MVFEKIGFFVFIQYFMVADKGKWINKKQVTLVTGQPGCTWAGRACERGGEVAWRAISRQKGREVDFGRGDFLGRLSPQPEKCLLVPTSKKWANRKRIIFPIS